MKLDELNRLRIEIGTIEQPADPQALSAYFAEDRNLYQEMEMTGRYVDTHPDDSIGRVQLHSHAFYEIIYFKSSCGVEYLVGSERYRIRKGDVVVIPPAISHRPLLPARMNEPYHRCILWISTEFVDLMDRLFSSARRPHPYLIRPDAHHQALLEHYFKTGIREAAEQGPDWEIALMGNTMMLITFLRRIILDETASLPPAEKPELMERIMSYIECHLSEKITLADTAQHFFVSPGTVNRTIRNKMGTSFYRCVTQRRLIAAKSLILQGAALESVNEQVGFSDYSTFYRAFKQEYGISPRQFKKLQGTQE